jgi:hypothetical protein
MAFSLSDMSGMSAARLPQQVVVDIGDRVKAPQVVRDGVAVGVHEIDPSIYDEFFAGRQPVRQVVVRQSIPAGTAVPEGTAVDIVLAQPSRVPIRIVKGVHTGLSTSETFQSAYSRLVGSREAEVRRIVARTEERGGLAVEDEARINEIFTEAEIPVTAEPGRDVDAAYATMQTLLTFGGG